LTLSTKREILNYLPFQVASAALGAALKSKTRKSRKLKRLDPISLAAKSALQRESEKQVKRIRAMTRANARVAALLSPLLHLDPENIPAALKRKIRTARKAKMRPLRRKLLHWG
jgi:hypothetical protein